MLSQDSIRFYLYIDKEGIDSIYAQIPGSKPNYKETISQQVDGKIDTNLKINTPFNAWGSISAGATADAQREIIHEQSVVITYEEKIKNLQENLNQSQCRFISDVLKNIPHWTNQLIVCKGLFRLIGAIDDNSNSKVSISDIRNNPYSYTRLSFNFCSTPALCYTSDTKSLLKYALEKEEYYVDMYFSGSKLVRSVRHITNEVKFGRDFMFTVLGELSYKGNAIYNLKPYAIWRQTDTNM